MKALLKTLTLSLFVLLSLSAFAETTSATATPSKVVSNHQTWLQNLQRQEPPVIRPGSLFDVQEPQPRRSKLGALVIGILFFPFGFVFLYAKDWTSYLIFMGALLTGLGLLGAILLGYVTSEELIIGLGIPAIALILSAILVEVVFIIDILNGNRQLPEKRRGRKKVNDADKQELIEKLDKI